VPDDCQARRLMLGRWPHALRRCASSGLPRIRNASALIVLFCPRPAHTGCYEGPPAGAHRQIGKIGCVTESPTLLADAQPGPGASGDIRIRSRNSAGTTVRVSFSEVSCSVLILLVMLRRPGVALGSGAIGRVPGGVVARCSRCSGRSRLPGALAARAACGLRVRSRGSGRCPGVVLAGAGGELAGVAPVFRLVSGGGAGAWSGRGPGRGGAGWPGGRDGE
jgi:hypothetical protein